VVFVSTVCTPLCLPCSRAGLTSRAGSWSFGVLHLRLDVAVSSALRLSLGLSLRYALTKEFGHLGVGFETSLLQQVFLYGISSPLSCLTPSPSTQQQLISSAGSDHDELTTEIPQPCKAVPHICFAISTFCFHYLLLTTSSFFKHRCSSRKQSETARKKDLPIDCTREREDIAQSLIRHGSLVQVNSRRGGMCVTGRIGFLWVGPGACWGAVLR
jgi:hypothetical protein